MGHSPPVGAAPSSVVAGTIAYSKSSHVSDGSRPHVATSSYDGQGSQRWMNGVKIKRPYDMYQTGLSLIFDIKIIHPASRFACDPGSASFVCKALSVSIYFLANYLAFQYFVQVSCLLNPPCTALFSSSLSSSQP